MAKYRFTCFIASLLLFTGGFLEAQAGKEAGWRIYQAEGSVILARDGVRTLYNKGAQEGSEPLEKILLKSGDLIQTSDGKAEMQMVFDGSREDTYTVIKICENTTVLVNDNPGKGIQGLEIMYGRIRLVTGTASSAISIQSGASLVNLQNGDIALDFIAKEGITQPLLFVHCFNGKGDFVPPADPGKEAAPLPLKAKETIFMDNQDASSYIEQKPLETAVITYWDGVPFTKSAPLPSPALGLASVPEQKQTETPKEAPLADKKEKQPREPRPGRSKSIPTLKDGLAIAGLLLVAAGTAMQAYTFLGKPDPSLGNKLYNYSYIPLGAGVAFILGSSFFNSGKAASD